MGETPRTVIIDTYALMAEATGEITPKAERCLGNVRSGQLEGIIHPIITYEFLLQYYKGRIPIFETPEETLDFLETYFSVAEISNSVALMAADIRFKSNVSLNKLQRKLSICDSLTIAIAKKTKSQVLTGDKDLWTVAEKENVEIIW